MLQRVQTLLFRFGVFTLAWFALIVSADPYDDTVLADNPWAYWRLNPILDQNVSIVPDASHQSDLRFGRFVGLLVDSDSCDKPPCVWGSNNTNETYASFNSRGKIVIPGFFLPPVQEFTVELWFSPACNTTISSDRQTLLRLENESTAFTPRLGLGHGEGLRGAAALNDRDSSSTYFASLSEISAREKTLSAQLWYHTALEFNGTALALYVDGEASAEESFPAVKQLGCPCVPEREGMRCVRAQGLVLGEGFNGRIQRVAVYDHALGPSRVAAHAKALSTHTGRASTALARPRPSSSSPAWHPSPELPALVGEGADAPRAAGEERWEAQGLGGSGGGRGWGDAGVDAANATGAFFACMEATRVVPEPNKYCASGAMTVSTLVAFLCLVLAAFVRLRWTEQAHLATAPSSSAPPRRLDRHSRSQQRLLAIPELLPVQHDPPMYPTATLMLMSVLLAVAYASDWYVAPRILSIAGRTVYPLQYLSWGVTELWGALLLLALAEFRLPQGLGAALLLAAAAGTTLGAFIVDLLGGEGPCSPDVQHQSWLDMALYTASGADADDRRETCRHGYGFPLIGLGLLSLVPAWVLSAPKRLPPSSHGAGHRAGGPGALTDLESSLLSDTSLLSEGRLGSKHQAGTLAMVRYWYFFSCFCRRSVWTLLVAIPSTGILPCWRVSVLIGLDCLSLLLFAAILFRSSAADWPVLSHLDAPHLASPSPSARASEGESGLLSPLEGAGFSESEEEEEGEGAHPDPAGDARAAEGGVGVGAAGGGAGRAGAGGRREESFGEIERAEDAVVSGNPPQDEGVGRAPLREEPGKRGEATMVAELRGMGYVVWRDAYRGGTQAVLGADFALARRGGAAVAAAAAAALGALLWLSVSPDILSVGCWVTGSDLQRLGYLPQGTEHVKVTCPQDGCVERANLIAAAPRPAPLRDPAAVLWGWNDVFGGGNASEGVYADSSALCRMALHAGAVGRTDSVCFSLSLAPGRAVYGGGLRNGVVSSALDLRGHAEGHAAFSIEPVVSPTICPFDLKWYIAACLLPLAAGLVAASLPPFALWTSLAAITFFLHVLLSINASDPFALPTRSAGISWRPYQLVAALIYLFLFSPAMYLLGPCWVLRATPWTNLLPTPSSQHRFAQRLSAPAKNPRELLSRNLLCFCLPMLAAGLVEHFLPASFFQDLSLDPAQADWVGDVHGLSWSGGLAWLKWQRVLLSVALVVTAFLAAFNLRLSYRAGELWRIVALFLLVALSLFVTTVVIHDRYQLRLRQYMLWAAFIPFTTHDHHVSAACQGVLLGLSVRGLVVDGAQPLWAVVEPISF